MNKQLTKKQKEKVIKLLDCFIPELPNNSFRFNYKGRIYYRVKGLKKLKTELNKVLTNKNNQQRYYMDNLFADMYKGTSVLSYSGLEEFGDVLLGQDAWKCFKKDILSLWKKGSRTIYMRMLQKTLKI